MIETVDRSPACVAAQDKAAWLALFATDGSVEDPVGTAPNRRGARPSPSGDDELGRFYATFIAGNAIRFEVIADLVAGDEVVRDVVIHTRLSTGLAIDVPAHLIYQLASDGGDGLRIARLRAVWDLRKRTLHALAAGWRGLYTLLVISARMFAIQGLRGVAGYTRGLVSGIFGRGRTAVARLVRAVAERDGAALESLCAPGASIEFPVGRPLSPREWLDALGPAAALRVAQVTPAGWLTSFRFETVGAGAARSGIAVLEFDRRSRRIATARFFAAEP